ncbi:MAG: iron-only hydrogenase system regulator [Clostridiales bacterium]|nr:iron-only hydrogenase system regulator [Clostridiales bacterium]
MSNETRIAHIGIIVEDMEAVEKLNGLLHEYGQYIIGRMGIPYREKDISIISVVLNARQDIISTLAGKLGMLKGVSVKTIYSKK